MKIGIASDHRGYYLKQKISRYLQKKKYEVIDLGTNSQNSVDYPDYALALATSVLRGEVDEGIAICGSGIGISIACNKIKGIRCAKVDNVKEAKMAKEHNNANTIALNGTMKVFRAKDILDVFLKAKFKYVERHATRLDKIAYLESLPKITKEDNHDQS